MLISYTKNQSSVEEIREHLESVSSSFAPPLSERINIGEYANKIHQHADCFEAWGNAQLVGLIACYANDLVHDTAYITNVSVEPCMRGRGIARHLLTNLLNDNDILMFKHIRLEVSKQNSIAITLYMSLGFCVESLRERTMIMCKRPKLTYCLSS